MYILYPFLTHTAQTYNMLKETAFLTIYKLQYAIMEEKKCILTNIKLLFLQLQPKLNGKGFYNKL